jgi:hypothetical protein
MYVCMYTDMEEVGNERFAAFWGFSLLGMISDD